MSRQGAEQTIVVPSEDPKRKDDKSKDNGDEQDKPKLDKANEAAAAKQGKDGAAKKEDELSEEDLQLKNELEMLVERLKVSGLQCAEPSHRMRALTLLYSPSFRSRTSPCIDLPWNHCAA